MNNEQQSFTTIILGDIESYIYLCMKLRSRGFWSFRGQRSEKWSLGPHVFDEKELDDLEKDEISSLEAKYQKKTRENLSIFRRYFIESPEFQFLQTRNNEWEWLFYAQHYGLKTPLLDWTSNPLVALYFAVENTISSRDVHESCGAVWALSVSDRRFIGIDLNSDPPDKLITESWAMVNPPPLIGVVPRLVRQSGKFTYHREPHAIEDSLQAEDVLYKIVLYDHYQNTNPAERIRTQLAVMNIHHASLFPEPDNVTKYLNTQWRTIALKERQNEMAIIDNRPNPKYIDAIDKLNI
jgi:hypothetical protein